MTATEQIPLADLLLDVQNARLPKEEQTQQATMLALAKNQGGRLVNLCRDIVENGLDPLGIIGVVATSDQKPRYRVIEGNRRVLALRALETPSTISSVLTAKQQKTLNSLADKFARNPIVSVTCALFETEDEAEHWVTLRHTGQNDGVGLVEWGAVEKDRYTARHGERSIGGQVIDFVEKHGGLSDVARQSNRRILTNLNRLLNTPDVRKKIGIEISGKRVVIHFPHDEVIKPLARIVEDLLTGDVSVPDIYHKKDRLDYIDSLGRKHLPRAKTRLDAPIDLEGDGIPVSPPKPKTRKQKRKSQRTAVIPKDCILDIESPRISSIFIELTQLSADATPNACAVLLRVFLELSVDKYIESKKLMDEKTRRGTILAKRLKTVAAHLLKRGKIPAQLASTVNALSNAKSGITVSTPTLNMYVHNSYAFPKSSDLRIAWDELQPFMEALWKEV